ncbi:MAG: SDR family NAD(P)-dependent oxidoreductase [Nodosilinea sp.]
MDVNVKGTFFCTQAALPALRQTNGSIVNVASIAGLNGYAHETVFGAAKAAVINLTRAMAVELAPRVRVNCVCPDIVNTDSAQAFVAAAEDPEAYQIMQNAAIPLKRIANPQEVSEAILFLASQKSAYITGVALPIDGGKSLGK